MSGIALSVHDLSKRFGRTQALRKLSFTLERGTTVALLGSNGAGKTTLLRILGGALSPTSGSVLLDGSNPGSDSAARARVGFLSHQPGGYGALSLAENLLFYARLQGIRSELSDAVTMGLQRMSLSPFADRPLRDCSQGIRRRYAIARALLANPQLLLLDEPFAGLDPTATREFEKQMTGWRGEGRTVVMVSHDLSHAIQLADRVLVLANGQLIADRPATGMNSDSAEMLLTSSVSA